MSFKFPIGSYVKIEFEEGQPEYFKVVSYGTLQKNTYDLEDLPFSRHYEERKTFYRGDLIGWANIEEVENGTLLTEEEIDKLKAEML